MFAFTQYKIHIFFILVFKIILIFAFPLTGDEAYFIKWGTNLSLGYYDHPPMIGWIIYLLSFLFDSYYFYRTFTLITIFTTVFAIYKIVNLYSTKENARYIAILFLISPVDILTILITNDVALMFFGSLGGLFFLYALERVRYISYAILSGITLGLAFLSKYFIIFLIFGLVLFALIVKKKSAILKIFIVFLFFLPFVMQNLYFNYNSCWNNIMFNFFARTENKSFNGLLVLSYLLMILYFVTPWGAKYIYDSREQLTFKNKLILLSTLILGTVFVVFLSVSLKNKIGLHWFLLFTPFIYIYFIILSEQYRLKLFKYNLFFSYIHIGILLTILNIPLHYFETTKKYSDIVFFLHTDLIVKNLQTIPSSRLFTTGYTSASMLSYYKNENIGMLFNNSKYGRLDDKLINVKLLDGQNLYIFDDNKDVANTLRKNCLSVSLQTFSVKKASYYIFKCENFNYKNYKKEYLDIQKEKFYNIPKWLPIGDCYFNERYYK